MEIAGVRWGRRGPAEVDRRVAVAVRQRPTYEHLRSTLGARPDGAHELVVERIVPGSVDVARAALRRWAPHAGIGGRVVPQGPPVEGATVAVVVEAGPVELLVANRIVVVVDETERYGVAYGTLPGHPERGEELFLATAEGPERVRLTVRAHAVGVGLARLGTPVTRWLQRRAAHRYVDAWAAALQHGPGGVEP